MDGELRQLFARNLRSAQWTSIESGLTAQGIPDTNYCFPGGHSGWLECKRTEGWAIAKSKSWPFQVGWIDRRVRMGGRAFVAVRRKGDELWLVDGSEVRLLSTGGLKSVSRFEMWVGGPAKWDWKRVEEILRGKYYGEESEE